MARHKGTLSPDSNPMKLYEFLREQRRQNPQATPSRREMADHFQTGTSVINYYLRVLVDAGLIAPLVKHRPREIILTGLRTVTLWVCPVPDCPHTSPIEDECEFHKVQMVRTKFREI